MHRYSVMREHAEANGMEEVDRLDTHMVESGKSHFPDDSDQVSHYFIIQQYNIKEACMMVNLFFYFFFLLCMPL